MTNPTPAKASMANGWQTFKIGELVTQNDSRAIDMALEEESEIE
jgi:hypothetical protein